MDIRNIQKTGNMHYVYLPTAWCKKNKISAESKVGLDMNNDGSLTVSPQLIEKKPRELKITVAEDDPDILQKLIIASYINPASSFKIYLEKKLDFTNLMQQRKLISLELVELGKNSITCDSSLQVSNASSLLNTMVRKIRNMLIVMIKNYNKELLDRYEEEIDRSQLLIEKSVIDSLTFTRTSHLKSIDLYYISNISKDLEKMTDRLINIKKEDKKFLEEVLEVMDFLKKILMGVLDEKNPTLDYKTALDFIKKVEALEEVKVVDLQTDEKRRLKQYLVAVSETLIDWAITKRLED